jgi:hypothetical protein
MGMTEKRERESERASDKERARENIEQERKTER